MKLDRKNILIASSVIVVALFLVAAAFLLVRGSMQFNDSEVKLELAKKRLKELYDKKPFPSKTNVAKEKENVDLLNEWFQKLVAAMRKAQVEPVQKSPTVFLSLLQGKVPELIQRGNASSKVVADDFAFGFARYLTSGTPPEPNDVPRLTQQLMIVEKICGVLFSANIEKLVDIQRETFEENADVGGPEAGTAGASRQRPVGKAQSVISSSKLLNKSAGLLGEQDLYAKFRFIIEFKAKESAAFNILNQLASHEMFMAVVSVEAGRDDSDLMDIKLKATPPTASAQANAGNTAAAGDPPAAAPVSALERIKAARKAAAGSVVATAPTPAPVKSADAEKTAPQPAEEKLARLERIVCGPELEKTLKVKIMLDVYRFRGE